MYVVKCIFTERLSLKLRFFSKSLLFVNYCFCSMHANFNNGEATQFSNFIVHYQHYFYINIFALEAQLKSLFLTYLYIKLIFLFKRTFNFYILSMSLY